MPNTPAVPERNTCSRCGENTAWELLDGAYVSVCCAAYPVQVDQEPDQLEGVNL